MSENVCDCNAGACSNARAALVAIPAGTPMSGVWAVAANRPRHPGKTGRKHLLALTPAVVPGRHPSHRHHPFVRWPGQPMCGTSTPARPRWSDWSLDPDGIAYCSACARRASAHGDFNLPVGWRPGSEHPDPAVT